jgi:hypothetical protein
VADGGVDNNGRLWIIIAIIIGCVLASPVIFNS